MKKIDDKLYQDLIDYKKDLEKKKRIKEIAIVGVIILAVLAYLNIGFNRSRKMLKTLPWYYIGAPNFWKKIGAPYPSKIPTWLDGLIILIWVFCFLNFFTTEDGQIKNGGSFTSILFFFLTMSLSYFFFSFFTKAVYENRKFNRYFLDEEEHNFFLELKKKLKNGETLTEKEDKFYKAYTDDLQR